MFTIQEVNHLKYKVTDIEIMLKKKRPVWTSCQEEYKSHVKSMVFTILFHPLGTYAKITDVRKKIEG